MYDLIKSYWAQIALIIGIISSVLNELIRSNTKIKEIKFSKLQDQKIAEITAFYKSYQKVLLSLNWYINYTKFGQHEKTKIELISKKCVNSLIEFDCQRMILKLFINENEIETIDLIYKNFKNVRVILDQWHTQAQSGNGITDEISTKYNSIHQLLSETQPNLLKRVETSLRHDFHV